MKLEKDTRKRNCKTKRKLVVSFFFVLFLEPVPFSLHSHSHFFLTWWFRRKRRALGVFFEFFGEDYLPKTKVEKESENGMRIYLWTFFSLKWNVAYIKGIKCFLAVFGLRHLLMFFKKGQKRFPMHLSNEIMPRVQIIIEELSS